MSSFYVTTPIYYVNAAPHLGHAYTTIAVDVMARHHRQRDEDVFFLTGTDEHGEPVADAAKAQGLEPKELADRNAERFRALMPRLGVSNDYFIRTSDERHGRRVQEVLQRVHDNGHVYKGLYEGWYCPRCADFKVENEIAEGNRCPIHEIELVRQQEENWFFRLSTFQGDLERLYAAQPDFVMPRERFNEAKAFIDSGLQDVSLSRGRLTWGVTVPWDPTHVFYVWFDALLNYYTALSFARDGDDLTDRFWPADFHVIGKDILKFHTVFWPAMLLAAGIPLPEHVFVHGFLLGADGRKMSKSLGNVLDPFEVMDRYGTEALRFYLLRDVTFGADGSTSIDAVRARYEGELANELGNLASRTIAMITRYRAGELAEGDLDPALAAEFDGLVDDVSALIDRAELTQALETIWQRVRRLNRYVEEQAPWQLAKDDARAGDLDRVLRTLAEGLRSVTVLLSPWLPESTVKLLDALGTPDLSLRNAAIDGGRVQRVSPLEPLFPEAVVIDSHTHLDSCPPPNDELVAAAVAAGVTRMLTVGMDGASCRSALAATETFPQVYAAVGRHPNYAEGFDDAALAEIEALAGHAGCVAIGETGLDYYRDTAPRADQERAFHAQIDLARATGKPLVIHTRAAEDDTIATLRARADGLVVIMHCFSMAGRLEECLAEGWWISFAGNVTYPKAQDLADAAERVPEDRLLVETDAPYLTPQVVRKERNQPAYVAHTAQFVAERREDPVRRARACGRAQRRRALRVVSAVTSPPRGDAPEQLPTQPTLRRLRMFGVRPKRDLGQNFLIDSNILGVIERAAALAPADVVLEIGGGLGVLSEHLAPRCAHVHVVEIDRALVPALEDALGPHANTSLHVADAMTLDLRTLEPAPTKVVANLPYGIAAGALLRTIEELDGVTRWVAMVQREVGERFAAAPGSGAYGVPSVLAQLACDVRVHRAVSRSVFHPVPNVDSVLVVLERRGPAAPPQLRTLVQAAFAHRRKALAGSLALAPAFGPGVRDRARAAVVALGHPADVRAERLAPEDFRTLGEALR